MFLSESDKEMVLFLPSLKENGFLDQVHMTVCNVGSRKISHKDSYSSEGWKYFIPNLSIYGFDADADACDAANEELEAQSISWKEKHIPIAINKRNGEATLYVTSHPMCSSLYPPNEEFLSRFQEIADPMSLDFSIEIETITLDEAFKNEDISEIDFLQIDVQGADLHVLEGATHLLSKCILAIKVEVEFSPLYINQPLFADVDSFLRKQGFSLFDLTASRFPRESFPLDCTKQSGQILWGDAIYVRDLIQKNLSSPLKNPEQILKLACISDIFNFSDYTLEILEYLTLNYGSDSRFNYSQVIIESLSKIPEINQAGIEKFPIFSKIRSFL